MTRAAFVVASTVLLALTACMPTTVTPPPPRAGEAPRLAPPPMPAPKPAPSPAPKARPPAPEPSDTCGAKALQYLVGRPKTEIPVPVDVKSRRVTCTMCPITMDYRPDRTNIFFDQATGIVKEVRCG